MSLCVLQLNIFSLLIFLLKFLPLTLFFPPLYTFKNSFFIVPIYIFRFASFFLFRTLPSKHFNQKVFI